MLYAATKIYVKKTTMQEHFYSYMVVLLLSRLKKVGSNLLVFANP